MVNSIKLQSYISFAWDGKRLQVLYLIKFAQHGKFDQTTISNQVCRGW